MEKIIDDFLIDTHFVRIGDYIRNNHPILFLCKKHNVEFKSTFGNLKNKINKGTGCNECVKEKVRLSNEIIDKRLEGRNIRRIGDYKTANEKIEWKMIDDGYRWFSTPANVLTKTKENKKRKILDENNLNKRLTGRNIVIIESCKNKTVKNKIKCKCLTCNTVWTPVINNLINKKYGCPNCKWHKREKEVKNIIEKYLNYDEFIMHKCIKIGDRRLYPDFFIKKENKVIIVEYNGIQHYKAIDYFGGEQKLIKQKERDKILIKYCLENNIHFIELKYNMSDYEIKNKLVEQIEQIKGVST